MPKIILICPFIFLAQFAIAYNTASNIQTCKADTIIPIPIADWHSHPIPIDEKTLELYGHDHTDWSLYIQNNMIYVINTYSPVVKDQLPGDSLPTLIAKKFYDDEGITVHPGNHILAVDDGFLIGISNGEWAAGLFWYSKDGKQKYKISSQSVIKFIKRNDRIFAIEGLAHLSESTGSMIEMSKNQSKWVATEYLELPAAPVAIALNSKNNFIVVTSNQLIEITEKKQILTLVDNAFWESYTYLYPSSLIIQNDIAYIGMRKGVFKYDLNTKKEEWLMNQ